MYDITIDSGDAVSIAWIMHGIQWVVLIVGIAAAIFLYFQLKAALKEQNIQIDAKNIGLALGIITFLYIFLN